MSYDYFTSLTTKQKKLIQGIKDFLDETNREKKQEEFIFARKIPVLDKDQYQIVVNTISKDKNNQVLVPFVLGGNVVDLAQFNPEEEVEEEGAEVAIIETVKSNNYSINERLKFAKRITNLEVEIPPDGLTFYIKLEKEFNVHTFALGFKDGNICSYKFDLLFIDKNNNIISELKSKRNTGQTALIEFYELETPVENVDRVVFLIHSKHNPLNITDTVAQIGDFILSDTPVQEELVSSKMISFSIVENEKSNSTYANHPSLLKLRVQTNQLDYPTLYEFESRDQYTDFQNTNEKTLKIFNPVVENNVFVSNHDGAALLRISNPDKDKYDDKATFSLTTLKKKGYIQLGGYKNRFIGMKFIPIDFDPKKWDITLVTRGGDMEESNQNLFHSIVKIGAKDFVFSRQLLVNKSDNFSDPIPPAFDIKLESEQEVGLAIYQFNINDTDVQYYIYVKRHNDVDWVLYNAFVDDSKLKGENYGEQTISWGGQYDYIFFNNFEKLKMLDLTVGELVTPIRKIE